MSQPAPSSPQAELKRKGPRKRFLAYLGVNSLALSICLHLAFGVGATFLIVEHFQKKKVNFHATEPPSQHTEVEHKVQLAKRNNVESAPPDIKRIVTKDVSSITLPEPPEVPTTDEANPSAMAGVDGVMGMGLGTGLGKGGNGGGGGMPLFGAPDGIGLEGKFYDLKQTQDRKPTQMNRGRFYATLSDFLRRGWNDSFLDQFYKSDQSLFSNMWAISTRSSEEAPKAFAVENEVQPAFWVVHYHGRVKTPNGGDYRFIGFGDNEMLVRLKGQLVLDAGWDYMTNDPNLHRDLPFVFPKYIPGQSWRPFRPQEKGFDRYDIPPAAQAWNPHLKIGPVFISMRTRPLIWMC